MWYALDGPELGVYNFTATVTDADGESRFTGTLVIVVLPQEQYLWTAPATGVAAGIGPLSVAVLLRRGRS